MIEAEFHFLRPFWFLAIIPLAFVIWRMTKQTMNQRGWAGIIDEALLPYVLVSKEIRTQKWPKILLGLLGLLAIIASAGPVWEQLPQPVFRNESAMVIALDLSRSMDVADLKPSRLIRARFKIADLLKQRKDGQTALLVFAADAYVVTPLTDDGDTILSQLKALTTDLMPQQGSRADRAMLKASELLKQAGSTKGDVLLITDGLKSDRDSTVAAKLHEDGYRVSVLGMGTKEGAPIPDLKGGFFSDASGNIILPALDERSLKVVAKSGGGIYQKYSAGDKDVNKLTIQFDNKPDENSASETEIKSDQWREQGPWILLLIIPFAAFAFRKGYLAVLVFCISSFLHTPESFANENMERDLWKRPDQKGHELLQEGEAEKAADLFEDQRWKGSAQYKAEDYEGALKSWEKFDDAEALYNKGNALAKMGKFEEALESYDQALKQSPELDDVKYNYDQVKKVLEEQEKQKQDQEGDQEKKSEDGEGDGSEDGDQPESDESSENPEEKDQQESSPEDEKTEGKDGESDQQDKPGEEEGQEEKNNPATGKEQDQNKEDEEQKNILEQAEQADSLDDETKQAVEAALRAIPDDPGGLLRRKFEYQYKRHEMKNETEEQQW